MRDLITSSANLSVKTIRSFLRSRKQRRDERIFVAEGVRLVEELLHHGEPTLIVYVPEQLAATPRGAALLQVLEQHPLAQPTTPVILAELSDVETPQGVVALARWPNLTPTDPSLVLVLDGVQDPGNVGALVRSAEAAGVDVIVCLPGTADVWSPKVVRAGMGTHLRLPIQQLDIPTARQTFQHLPWFAAMMDAPQSYDAINWCAPAALVVGNEANGIDAALQAVCQPITIPMLGQLESLNAAIAGSIILFEAARQRRK